MDMCLGGLCHLGMLHLFNREENYGIVDGAWPDKTFYDPGSMKPGAKKEFETWYQTVRNQKFNFKEELVSYCQTDVRILMFGIRKFRELFKSVTGIDPITRTFTLASVASIRLNAPNVC